ncbi:hypothetical protein C8Q76DRAFT_727642 [Earliella scabrosa]|nr:hypothetical protein C8Q76DRAFT_727642 [Earliella scabrosa]
MTCLRFILAHLLRTTIAATLLAHPGRSLKPHAIMPALSLIDCRAPTQSARVAARHPRPTRNAHAVRHGFDSRHGRRRRLRTWRCECGPVRTVSPGHLAPTRRVEGLKSIHFPWRQQTRVRGAVRSRGRPIGLSHPTRFGRGFAHGCNETSYALQGSLPEGPAVG